VEGDPCGLFIFDMKNSFILYNDLLPTVEKLSDETAGRLLKMILQYANGDNPTTDDLVLDVIFGLVQQQIKRDTKKYSEYIKKQRDNGRRGGRPKKPAVNQETQKTQPFLEKPKKADNDNVNVNDNVSASVNNKQDTPPIIPPKGGKRGTQIPDKSYFDMSVAEKYSMNPDIAFEIFELWATSKGQIYKDWNAAWRKACCDWLPERHAKVKANQQIQSVADIQTTLVEPINWKEVKLRYPEDTQQRIGDTWEDVPDELKGYLIEDCNKQGKA